MRINIFKSVEIYHLEIRQQSSKVINTKVRAKIKLEKKGICLLTTTVLSYWTLHVKEQI